MVVLLLLLLLYIRRQQKLITKTKTMIMTMITVSRGMLQHTYLASKTIQVGHQRIVLSLSAIFTVEMPPIWLLVEMPVFVLIGEEMVI